MNVDDKDETINEPYANTFESQISNKLNEDTVEKVSEITEESKSSMNNEDISNREIYFLADNKIYNEFDEKKLRNFNSFTDTKPAFRANFKIYINQGGFSSYQSEYPYSMITKKGTIISSISSLANPDADKNYILIRNIDCIF